MEDMRKIADSLHPLERKVLPLIKKHDRLSSLITASGLADAAVMRALQWLANKSLVVSKEDFLKRVELDKNGLEYAVKGLPEYQILRFLIKHNSPIDLTELREKLGMEMQELQFSIGLLKRKNLIALNKVSAEKTMVSLTDQGKTEPHVPEEHFLKWLGNGKKDSEILKHEDRLIMHDLLTRRQIIKIALVKDWIIEYTQLGKEMSNMQFSDVIESLSPEMLRSGNWQGQTFRRYDVRGTVPRLYGGKKQHYKAFHDTVRKKFLSMGFTEMFGPVVESDFWDMDALFMPQFHSARDIHEAYYLKEPAAMEIDAKILKNVKDAHENGIGTGSKGWRYKFDVNRTKRTLLRTQGTACSARMLTSKDLKIPGKYFAMAKCFRYDVIDATHLPDFFQTEGIVLGEGLNFKSLKGVLKMFAEEFAETDQVKIKPAYFPFTEPSAELFAKHPEMGWIELGGSGIFRPELCKALGVNVPVIAWGLGIDRIGMFNMKINDIRNLYSQDLAYLRNHRL
ncbi:MAG: phenylalanine--tRNA ligase subunit alpha [Candidatus Woesearchaeota archaeon]